MFEKKLGFSSGKHTQGFPLGQEEGGIEFVLKLDEHQNF